MPEDRIIGLLKNVGEFIVAQVIEETYETLVVKEPALLGVSQNGGQINVQFIPVDLISVNPVVGIRNMLKNPTQELLVSFQKKDLILYSLELADNVLENYKRTFVKPALTTQTSSPDDNIVKLF